MQKHLNEAIKYYNLYLEGEKKKEVVLAKVEQIREYGDKNDFSDWQYDILNDIKNLINSEDGNL